MTNVPSPDFLDLQAAVSGRYVLDRELGRGGMGIVFLAREVALDRSVAIKLLPRHLAHDATVRERFLREARTAGQLMHPNIVPIHSVETLDAFVFFVMAYVEGETLAARVGRVGMLPPAAATRLFQEVAWALGYAHGRGVIHRDIKPENILIEGATGRALVADFGIAQLQRQGTLSPDGALVGTVQYMSPEQASAEALDGRSDLYSLGATVYFALTGRSPVEGGSLPEMLLRLMTEEATPLSALRPDLPVALVNAVSRSLAKARDGRFASADELAQALQFTVGLPPPVTPEVRTFLVRMNSAGLLLTGGLAVLVLPALPIALGLFPRGALALFLAIGAGGIAMFGFALFLEMFRLIEHRIPWPEIQRQLSHGLDELEAPVGSGSRLSGAQQTTAVIALSVSGAGIVLLVQAVKLLVRAEPQSAVLAGLGGVAALVAGEFIGRRMPKLGPTVDRPALHLKPKRAERSLATLLVRRIARSRMIGRWYNALLRQHVAAVKQMLGGSKPVSPAATLLLDRVTALFEQLQPDVRTRLGDVVPIAAALERAVAALRERATRIDSAIAELPAGDAAIQEFRGARERIDQRVADGVGALERLRTDLLRLSAGLIAADGITAEIEKAQELSAAIDAELHGRDEVRQLGR